MKKLFISAFVLICTVASADPREELLLPPNIIQVGTTSMKEGNFHTNLRFVVRQLDVYPAITIESYSALGGEGISNIEINSIINIMIPIDDHIQNIFWERNKLMFIAGRHQCHVVVTKKMATTEKNTDKTRSVPASCN